ncbi:zinc-binding dehydrogenase [Deinococcus planocerae]|uniref:zinc-binding dehydrogenase n=1 Tax=Deinococcus planocerae TaxID=1737569 RepID=UPI000C7F03EA|nr:zinc-binding dehydrogenase [Deinococcus planocerae]
MTVTGTRTRTSALIVQPREVEVRETPLPPLGPNDVLVENIASGISSGTEMNVYRGLAPQWHRRQDPVTRLFVPGGEPQWAYPLAYGYASVGRVVEVGDEVLDRAPGQLVFAYSPHQTLSVVPRVLTLPLPADTDPTSGVFVANLNTAFNGLLDARPVPGSDLVVFGAGVIGQLLVRLLARTGPRTLTVVDGITSRRETALRGGATHGLEPGDSVAPAVRELTGNRGADVAFEVSGASPALGEAIRTVGYEGLVVAMSWYGQPVNVDLGGEFHHNRVRVRSSQGNAVNPDLSPLWTVERRQAQCVAWLGGLDLASLVSHRFPIEEASEAYRLLDERPQETLQVVLTYGVSA